MLSIGVCYSRPDVAFPNYRGRNYETKTSLGYVGVRSDQDARCVVRSRTVPCSPNVDAMISGDKLFVNSTDCPTTKE